MHALAEYGRVWALHALCPALDALLSLAGTPFWALDSRPIAPGDWLWRFPLALLALAFPTRWVILLAHAVSLASFAAQLPTVWDHMCWIALLELTFVLAALMGGPFDEEETLWARFTGAARPQLICLYFSAAFWKLTTSFLDHTTSCATVLVAELAAAIVPPAALPAQMLTPLLRAAPLLIVAIEFAVPLALWLCPRAGVAVALLFHQAINLMPLTYAGGFSSAMCSRLLFFAPGALTGAATSVGDEAHGGCSGRTWFVASAVGVVLVSATAAIRSGLDASAALFIVLELGYLRGAILNAPPKVMDGQGKRRSGLRALSLAAAALYGFGGPVLGVQAMGSSTMFAGLLQFGAAGGNHLLVPAGVLAPLLGSAGLDEMVRVDALAAAANSSALQALLPQDMLPLLPARAVELMRAAGARSYYAAYVNRMGSFGPLPPASADAPLEHVPFAPYAAVALPAFELRRGLALARARGERFRLSYTRLPRELRSPGAWLAHDGHAARVVLDEDSRAGRANCTANGGACTKGEPALLPAPPRWLSALLLPYPTPLHSGDSTEIRCIT